jgi:Threonine dehydrogenase and related Zn-dependent dehydrogenases
VRGRSGCSRWSRPAGSAPPRVDATDVLEEPLARAKGVGAERTYRIGVDEVEAEAYDVVLECSGVAPSVSTALVAVRRRGAVVQIGMLPDEPRPINLAPLVAKEVTLHGAFRFLDEIDEAIEVLRAQPEIEQVITDEFAPSDAVAAFGRARRSDESGKVVVSFVEGAR